MLGRFGSNRGQVLLARRGGLGVLGTARRGGAEPVRQGGDRGEARGGASLGRTGAGFMRRQALAGLGRAPGVMGGGGGLIGFGGG